jgi:HAD superfamily hydrolase (TIGR01457 family)
MARLSFDSWSHTISRERDVKRIAGVILAAGSSTRFGQPKQLIEWDGVPLVRRTAREALCAGLAPVVVVLGSHGQQVNAALEHAALGPTVRTVMNWRWEQGLSTSLQVGLMALPPDTEGALLLQCDQPLVSAEILRALVQRFEQTGAPIVFPTHGGQRYPPALFSQVFFGELAGLSGDVGGRALADRHPNAVATLPVEDPVLLADVDTPDELEQLRRLVRTRPPAAARPSLAAIRYLICDMDGVLWHGDRPLPGLQKLFAFLQGARIGYILATNNSSRTPEQYTAKLAGFGIQVAPEHILTSSQVAAAYLASIAPAATRVYAIGEDGLCQALQERGFVLGEEGAQYVVVGWDRHLTWDKLAAATLLIDRGAGFIGTNPDYNYPTERGPAPGNGAQLAALATATRVQPVVVGKPEPEMYCEAMRRMGAPVEATAVVGDRLDTDIAGGVDLGMTTILVLSGIATEEMLTASPTKPDLVFAGLPELLQAWQDELP